MVAQANTLAECHGWSPFVAVQARYSLLSREAERDLLPAADALGMSVAVWSPLAGGVLTGKFAKPGGSEGPTRIAAETLSERDHAVARAVQEVAGQLGATSSQVALAWMMRPSKAVHPIVGVSRLEQLEDNLGATDVTLSDEAIASLEAAAGFDVGFPHDFIRDMQSFVYGEAAPLVDG